jgi:hypothetical protein
VLIAALLRVCALLLEKRIKFGTRGREVKSEYRIQDEGRPGARIPNTLDEYISALKSENRKLVQQYPSADAQLKQLLQALGDTEDVARHIPASVWESAEWSAIVNAAEENGASCCKGIHGKTILIHCTALIQ